MHLFNCTFANKKKIIFESLVIIFVLPAITSVLLFWLLYNVKLAQEKKLLQEMTRLQATSLDEIATIATKYEDPKIARKKVLALVTQAQKKYTSFLNTGEMVLASKNGDEIEFFLLKKLDKTKLPLKIPFKQLPANTPIKLAVSGMTGVAETLDFKGHKVVAAYEYLPKLKLGIVIKLDISELAEVYVSAGVFFCLFLIIMLCAGIWIYYKCVPPLIDAVLKAKNDYQELVHVLCHDLNNTFTVIKMACDLSSNSDIPLDDFNTQISKSLDNGISLIALIKEMESLESKHLHLLPTNLTDAIKQSEFIIENKLIAKDITLKTNVPEDLFILAEPRALINSIICNLLTNAIKFSQKGSEIFVEAKNVDKGKVIFSVEDKGIGMPPEILKKIFEPGKVKSRNGTDGEKGTGFGISLVYKFVKIFNGEITVSSTEEKLSPKEHGTKFTITFVASTERII